MKKWSLAATGAALMIATASAGQDFAGLGTQIERGRLRTECSHPGIKRVRTYDVTSPDIPYSFNNYRIAFVADTHYPSLFTDETLVSLGNILRELNADLLLLGGDYQEDCEHVEPLFKTMMESNPRDGAMAVLGNNDLERCTDLIKSLMKDYGITLVEDTCVTITVGNEHIRVAGVNNTYTPRETAVSPTLKERDGDFVILMTHTPDYAEDQDISHADLTLAGHTHGGQVTMMGAWAPITASHYGQRFLKGLNWNSAGQPVITTTGIGTSRRDIRLFAPSEVILLTLHTLRKTPPSTPLAADKSFKDIPRARMHLSEIREEAKKEGQEDIPIPKKM